MKNYPCQTMYRYCGKCGFVQFCHEAEAHNRVAKQNRIVLYSAIGFLIAGVVFTLLTNE